MLCLTSLPLVLPLRDATGTYPVTACLKANISWTHHSTGQHKQLCIIHHPSNFRYFVIFICKQSEHSLKQSELSDSILHLQDLERGSTRQSFLKGPEGPTVNQTNTGIVSKAMLGKLLRDRVERIWAFLSAQISWTELNWIYALLITSQWCACKQAEVWIQQTHLFYV